MTDWFTTWIAALENEKVTLVAFEAGTVVSYATEDLVMIDANGEPVAIVAM